MTDPLMAAFCCRKPARSTQFFGMMVEIDSEPYNIICLLSATCGILGAVYQILPEISAKYSNNWYWITSRRGRKTVIWLAVSDLLATLGIFVRSLLKLITPSLISRIKSNTTYCILLSFWIQYFFIVSWFWTLIYATDIYLAVKEKQSYTKTYHLISWILPAIFTFTGLYFLYYPQASCFNPIESTFWKFFPNYLVSYIPLLVVMILLPVLYFNSAGSLHIIVSQCLSQYTNRERHIVDMIKIRFSLINLTFYACWLPNIVNTILLYSFWDAWNQRVIVSLWYVMAIMNPLQALFNCLVYQRPENKFVFHWNRASSGLQYNYYENTERTPLLARKSGSSNTSDELDFVL